MRPPRSSLLIAIEWENDRHVVNNNEDFFFYFNENYLITKTITELTPMCHEWSGSVPIFVSSFRWRWWSFRVHRQTTSHRSVRRSLVASVSVQPNWIRWYSKDSIVLHLSAMTITLTLNCSTVFKQRVRSCSTSVEYWCDEVNTPWWILSFRRQHTFESNTEEESDKLDQEDSTFDAEFDGLLTIEIFDEKGE